jgi:hypothetical protein
MYSYASCGCPVDAFGLRHLPGCRNLPACAPEGPPPPIGPGSRVRLADHVCDHIGLRPGQVYTVERAEDRGGKVFVFLAGDPRLWKVGRFTAET